MPLPIFVPQFLGSFGGCSLYSLRRRRCGAEKWNGFSVLATTLSNRYPRRRHFLMAASLRSWTCRPQYDIFINLPALCKLDDMLLDSEPNTTGGVVLYEAGASQNGGAPNGGHAPSQGTITQPVSMIPVPAAATSGGVVGPTTNLNIGMDYWGVPTPSQIAPVRGKVPNALVAGLVPSWQNMQSELWLQVSL